MGMSCGRNRGSDRARGSPRQPKPSIELVVDKVVAEFSVLRKERRMAKGETIKDS